MRLLRASSHQVAHLKRASLNTIRIEKNLLQKGLPAYLNQLEFIKIAIHKPYIQNVKQMWETLQFNWMECAIME